MEESKNDVILEDHVYPPFASLPSFNVDATILSYVYYNEDAQRFLTKLSKNAGKYYENHKNILKGFIKQAPKLTNTLEFGETSKEWLHEYPSPEQFK